MKRQMQILMKEARKNKGLTQADVGKLMGVKGGTVSNWENGISEPDIDSFVQFCNICGVDFKDLLTEVYGDPTEPKQTIDVTSEEAELIHMFQALDKGGKRRVMRTVRGEYEDAIADFGEESRNAT